MSGEKDPSTRLEDSATTRPDYDRMRELRAGDPVTDYVGRPDIQRQIIEEDFFKEHGLDAGELDPDAPIVKIPITHG